MAILKNGELFSRVEGHQPLVYAVTLAYHTKAENLMTLEMT